jgi:hypothetical protein
MELEMIAVTMRKRAEEPDPRKPASISQPISYREAFRFKIEQLECIQSRPPFDDHLPAA